MGQASAKPDQLFSAIVCGAILLIGAWPCAAGPSAMPAPPGVVIDFVPAASGNFVGSPSIVVLPGGNYLATHDLFGPKSSAGTEAVTRVFRSADRGITWERLGDIHGAFWSTLFVHKACLYLLGTTAEHGNAVIRRSTDGGATWTTPRDTKSGLLRVGQYHCAPVPVVEHADRVWRAIEDAGGGREWGRRYRAMMLSAPADADLLDAGQWQASNFISRDAGWLGGRFNAWLEGNAVVAPDGGMVDMLRVDVPPAGQTAALVRVSSDGSTATFDPGKDFVRFPGGATKFTVRFDAVSRQYWSLVNDVPEPFVGKNAAMVRNTLELVSSPNLRDWSRRGVVLRHSDASRHGFQYADWQFDGDDLIVACRTAFDEPEGQAHSFHDANYLTFHRVRGFRQMPLDLPASQPATGPLR
jgi:hypothetical protein